MKTIDHAFKNLDFLGKGLNLRIGESESLKTRIGAILSILTAGLILTSIFFLIVDFFKTDSPQVGVESTVGMVYPRVSLTQARRIPVIFGYLDDSKALTSEELSQYVTLSFVRFQYEMTSSEYPIINATSYMFMPCKTLIEQSSLAAEIFHTSQQDDLTKIIKKRYLPKCD